MKVLKVIPKCMACNTLIYKAKLYKDLFFCNEVCEKKYNQKIINKLNDE